MKKIFTHVSVVLLCLFLALQPFITLASQEDYYPAGPLPNEDDPLWKNVVPDTKFLRKGAMSAALAVTRRDYNGNGVSLGKYLDVTYYSVLKNFEYAIRDNWYLGKPYDLNWELDQNGMNCEGFVYAHLINSGANKDKVFKIIGPPGERDGWITTVLRENIKYTTYTGNNWDELCNYIVNDNLIQPGDIVWMWNGEVGSDGLTHKLDDYHHVAFYIGDYFDGKNVESPYWQKLSGDKARLRIWHSTMMPPPDMKIDSGGCNITSRMYGKVSNPPYAITVFPLHFGGYGIKIIKSSAMPDVTDGNIHYSLKGAEYDIYKNSKLTQREDHIVTDDKGEGITLGYRPGIFYIKETKAPPNYELDKEIHTVEIPSYSPELIAINVKDRPVIKYGKTFLSKSSAKPAITDGNECYSLQGAEYNLYTDEACTSNPVGTFITDFTGKSNVAELQEGTYWVKETKAPKGYLIDQNIYKINVKANETYTLNIKDDIKRYEYRLQLWKKSSINESGENIPLDDAELTLYEDIDCTKEIKKGNTKNGGYLCFDNLEAGRIYFLKETKAPEGYRVPLDVNGGAVVYSIKVIQDTDNNYVLFVNDEVIPGGVNIKAPETADETVTADYTIINHVINGQLPKTGTYIGAILPIMGIVFIWIAYRNAHRNNAFGH